MNSLSYDYLCFIVSSCMGHQSIVRLVCDKLSQALSACLILVF